MDDSKITTVEDNDENYDGVSLATTENGNGAKEKKQGIFSRFRTFLFNRGAEKTYKKENGTTTTNGDKNEKTVKETRKLNEYLDAIETQLDKMDEQNKILLFHLSTVKENNEALLHQVTVLSKNNDQLFQQFKASKKREKFAKIIAIVASCLAIGFWVYQFVKIFLGQQ